MCNTYWGDSSLSSILLGHDDMSRIPRMSGQSLRVSNTNAYNLVNPLFLNKVDLYLLCLMGYNLDKVHKHLASDISSLGAK